MSVHYTVRQHRIWSVTITSVVYTGDTLIKVTISKPQLQNLKLIQVIKHSILLHRFFSSGSNRYILWSFPCRFNSIKVLNTINVTSTRSPLRLRGW